MQLPNKATLGEKEMWLFFCRRQGFYQNKNTKKKNAT